MSNPYTSVSVTGAYNQNPPSDDASEVSGNQVEWSKHLDKIGNPLKAALESINTNNTEAHGRHLGQTVESVSTNRQVAPEDRGSIFAVTGGITITLLAVGDAGNGFPIVVVNVGSGTVTIDGNASELINGETSLALAPGDWTFLNTEGSAWTAASVIAVQSQVGSFVPTFGGFSSAPSSPSIQWVKRNNTVQISQSIGTGTSNGVTFTITNWPAALRPAAAIVIPLVNVVDNGVVSWGSLLLSNSATAQVYYEGGGIFTGSGSKGFDADGRIVYSYPLSTT